MASIEINDLSVVENLTPEQQEEILGAGVRKFKPTFDSLESRELMDAGLGGALTGLVARPQVDAPAAHVRELAPMAQSPVQILGMDQVLTQAPKGDAPRGDAPRGDAPRGAGVPVVPSTTQEDAEGIKNDAASLIQQKLIPQLSTLAHAKLMESKASVVSDTVIRLTFKVRYTDTIYGSVDGSTDYYGTISLDAVETWWGPTKGYKLTNASLDNFDRSRWLKSADVSSGVNKVIADNPLRGAKIQFNTQKFAEGVAKQAESICRGMDQKGTGGYVVDGVEWIEGGLRVRVQAGTRSGYPQERYGLIFHFKYNSADLKAGSVRLTNLQSGAWFAGHGWQTHDIYSQGNLENAIWKSGNRWNLAG
jgi:hypothetical protein